MIKQKIDVRKCISIINSSYIAKDVRDYLYHVLEWEENFETFCRFILPHAFTHPFCEMHKEIFQEFNTKNDSVVAAPRGHGKSTLIGLGFVLWLLVYKKEKYLVYTSQNHEKSVQFLEPIKQELQNNKLLKFIYGDINIRTVKDEEDTSRNREDCFDYYGIRIQALSFEKNIRGLKYGVTRPTLIILDDIDDDQRCLNPELRRKDNDKLTKQIIPSLDPSVGRIKMVGTILHHDSLLAKRLRVEDGKIYRAISEDGKILFPGLYNQAKLDDIKRKIGSTAFQSEYLNNPVDDSASIIKREWVRECFEERLSFTDDYEWSERYLGVDFAFSDRVSADKSAFVEIAKQKGVFFITKCDTRKGMSVVEQFEYIQKLHEKNKYKDIALEENSIRSMSKELNSYNFPYTLYWTGANDPAQKLSPELDFQGKRKTVGKLSMIDRLATAFENKIIKIPYKTEADKVIAHQIMDELTTFARSDGKLVETGVHGDIPIALGYAMERCNIEEGVVLF